jgi:glycerophosphoryl diester phosphodiesterase
MAFDDLSRPVVFSHRGASAFAPENTLAAFRLAAELGAPAIELDVKLTADKRVVVLHDPSLNRTTNGHGLLAQATLAEVKKLDAGAWFAAKFAGENIPTLAEVFDAVGQQMYINIELTNYTTPLDDLVVRVVDLVRAFGMQPRVIFSSFNPLNLIRAGRLIPEVPLGLLAIEGHGGALARSFVGNLIPHQALHPNLEDVNQKLVERVHGQGRRVHVWTVNPEDEMRRLFAYGVDGIFTDDPSLALRVLAEARHPSGAIAY